MRNEREDSYSGFEDALDEMTPMQSTLVSVMEKKEEEAQAEEDKKELLSRVRSESELQEFKNEFDKEAKETSEISRESVSRLLRRSKSRVVKRVLSRGKFDVSELEKLAIIRDSDNSNTSSFKELVEVLHAADSITNEEEGKEDDDNLASTKMGSTDNGGKNDDDGWSKAEKMYTASTIERHHRRSSARRSLVPLKVKEEKKVTEEDNKISATEQVVENEEYGKENKDEKISVERIIKGVPHPRQSEAEDCACDVCVLM